MIDWAEKVGLDPGSSLSEQSHSLNPAPRSLLGDARKPRTDSAIVVIEKNRSSLQMQGRSHLLRISPTKGPRMAFHRSPVLSRNLHRIAQRHTETIHSLFPLIKQGCG